MSTQRVRLPQTQLVTEESPGWDLRILVPTLALVAIGVAMVFSAGIPIAAREHTSVLVYLYKQGFFVVLGLVAMFAAARLSLSRLYDRAFGLLVVTVALLVGVHVLGKEINGAKSWYSLPLPVMPLSFQPSELAKLTLVIALARYFSKFPQGLREWGQLAAPLMMLGLVCGSIATESDIGTAAVIGLAMLMFFHIAGAKVQHVGTIALLAAAAVGAKILHEPYQLERIKAWLGLIPGAESDGNYQILASLTALGSGGLFGRGYCQGLAKYFYLPESTTDAILAVTGEELGLIATLVVVLLFAYLVLRGMQVAGRAEDRFAGLVAAGITSVFGVQALMNIAVITGAIPTTGVTLPFVSYGGSSLLFSMAGVGLLLNVARGKKRARG